jgi:hypothetical protein
MHEALEAAGVSVLVAKETSVACAVAGEVEQPRPTDPAPHAIVPDMSKPKRGKLNAKTLEIIKALGAEGGRARAKNLTKERRSEIARGAVQARWDKVRRAKKKKP